MHHSQVTNYAQAPSLTRVPSVGQDPNQCYQDQVTNYAQAPNLAQDPGVGHAPNVGQTAIDFYQGQVPENRAVVQPSFEVRNIQTLTFEVPENCHRQNKRGT